MYSLIEKIRKGKLWDFAGGVHPPGRKAMSMTTAINHIDWPEKLFLATKQHSGMAGILLVQEGEYVLKGQPLTAANKVNQVPIHAPTSGVITAIGEHVSAHPSGLPEQTVVLTPDGKHQWRAQQPIEDYRQLSRQQLTERIQQAGISGLGGAGFPTHRKISADTGVEFLIINGVECEPYITADDSIMRHHGETILDGIKILQHLLNPSHTIIAIEDNKPDALKHMKRVCQQVNQHSIIADNKATDWVDVVSIPTKYPAGGEKQLIEVLTGRQVPSKGLSMDVGVVMFNVGTCYAIERAVTDDIPLIERVVTLTGEGIDQPQNVWAPLGTPVEHLLTHGRKNNNCDGKVVMGGPMMGFAVRSPMVPVVKITNCILVPAKLELNSGDQARECIRCSACADACPAQLLPQQLYWHAKAQEWQKTQDYHLFDCIECGACAYVCPSEIPLVQYYRNAKQEIRSEELEKRAAEHAKQRFEARKQRLEQEQQARLEKQRLASEKRRNAMASDSSNAAKDKIAAAMARVKAKQQAPLDTNSDNSDISNNTDTKKASVAAAVARAKAKKLAQQQATQKPSTATDPTAVGVTSDNPASEHTAVNEPTSVETSPEAQKKARVAAAVARAKAKKQAQQQVTQTPSTATDPAAPGVTSDKPVSEHTAANEPTSVETSPEAQKKARVAAAVARARAKKLAQQQVTQTPSTATDTIADNTASETAAPDTPSAENTSPEAQKKARIAAAVARAKAKKQARQIEQGNDE